MRRLYFILSIIFLLFFNVMIICQESNRSINTDYLRTNLLEPNSILKAVIYTVSKSRFLGYDTSINDANYYVNIEEDSLKSKIIFRINFNLKDQLDYLSPDKVAGVVEKDNKNFIIVKNRNDSLNSIIYSMIHCLTDSILYLDYPKYKYPILKFRSLEII